MTTTTLIRLLLVTVPLLSASTVAIDHPGQIETRLSACDRCPPVEEDLFRWDERECRVGAINRALRFTFAVDSDEMDFPQNRLLVDSVLQFMKTIPSVELEVAQHLGGYSRLRKSQESHLTQMRAQAIVNSLIEGGISPSRLVPVGYGATQPLIGRDSIAAMDRSGKQYAHEANRRTEFKILRCR